MTMIVSCYSIALLQLLFISKLTAVSSTSTTTAGAVNSNRKLTKLHVLVYETSKDAIGIDTPSQRLVDQINNGHIERMVASIFGQSNNVFGQSSSSTTNNYNVDVDNYGFAGYGSKFHSVLPVLTSIMEDTTNDEYDNLVVISDSRDVLLNNPFNDFTYSNDLVDEFKNAYDDIVSTKINNGIIISAEAQCCVSALTHVPLGGYYNTDGTRKEQACSSGSSNCLWAGDDKAIPWENFMKQVMIQSTSTYGSNKQYDDIYLNSGLMVGTPTNLLRIINNAQINNNEDDQAVWTDYMYHNPNDIILDYSQKLFGNNRGGVSVTGNSIDNGCVFHQEQLLNNNNNRLVHSITNTQPLFIHSPGQYFICHEQLSTLLNVPQVSSIVRRKLSNNDVHHRLVECNYGRFGSNCNRTIVSETISDDTTNTTTTNLLGSLLLNRTTTTTTTTTALAPVPVPAPVSALADLLTAPRTTPTITTGSAPVPVSAPTSALFSFLQQAKVPVVATAPVPVPVATVPVSVPVSVPVQLPTIAVPLSSYLTAPDKNPPVSTTRGKVRGGSKD